MLELRRDLVGATELSQLLAHLGLQQSRAEQLEDLVVDALSQRMRLCHCGSP
jgi:hypothetical protein